MTFTRSALKPFIIGIFCSLLLNPCFSQEIEEPQQSKEIEQKENSSFWTSLNKYFKIKLDENGIISAYKEKDKQQTYKLINGSNMGLKVGGIDIRTYNERNEQMLKMQMLASHISDNNSLELEKAEKIIMTTFNESERENIDPVLMLSVISVESKFNQYAKSHMGAVGLVQVMPRYHKTKIKALSEESLDMWSIEGNIKLGVNILKEYLTVSNGDVTRALQMYNGSLGDRTRSYSKKVLHQKNNLDKAVQLAKN